MAEYTVRRIKSKDLFTLATIFAKCGSDAVIMLSRWLSGLPEDKAAGQATVEKAVKDQKVKVSIAQIKKVEEVSKRFETVGLVIFTSVFKYAESDIKKWLIDMVGMKEEEFDDLPFEAPIDIIKIIMAQEDWKSFFGKALALINTASGTGQT